MHLLNHLPYMSEIVLGNPASLEKRAGDDISLLVARFAAFSMKCPVSCIKSLLIFTETDKCKSGNISLHWFLYVSWQFRK